MSQGDIIPLTSHKRPQGAQCGEWKAAGAVAARHTCETEKGCARREIDGMCGGEQVTFTLRVGEHHLRPRRQNPHRTRPQRQTHRGDPAPVGEGGGKDRANPEIVRQSQLAVGHWLLAFGIGDWMLFFGLWSWFLVP